MPPRQYPYAQDGLQCAAQHLAYSSITGSIMGESGKYDAFETTLQILRMKKKYPKAMPFEFVDLDDDFRAFMDCRLGLQATHAWTRRELCSQSTVAPHKEFLCGDCSSSHKSNRAFGIPGGFVCCGHNSLGDCPRLWD
eukprot:gene31280-6425_t